MANPSSSLKKFNPYADRLLASPFTVVTEETVQIIDRYNRLSWHGGLSYYYLSPRLHSHSVAHVRQAIECRITGILCLIENVLIPALHTELASVALSLAMACHPRLGQDSPLHSLDPELVAHIAQIALNV
jgi:hypothetical protein